MEAETFEKKFDKLQEPVTLEIKPVKVDTVENIKVSEFIYPNEENRDKNYHIYINISGTNLKLTADQKEMVQIFVENLKDELLESINRINKI